MPSPDAIVLPEVTTVEIRLDPVQTIVNSMVLLLRSEELSGLSPWIYETYTALTEEQKSTHNLVIIGLHYAVTPNRFWKDFPSYLAGLEKSDPQSLRNKVLDFYLEYNNDENALDQVEVTRESLLEDLDFFLDYLKSKFGEEEVCPEIETKAFELLNDPPRMKELILSHLNFMWDEFYQEEWKRNQPLLSEAVRVFEKTDFSSMSKAEAIQYVSGKDNPQEFLDKVCSFDDHLIFVPSLHNGPYLGMFHYKNALGVIFGARLPEDADMDAPALSRNEIITRLNALADDIRLQILKLIAEEGEKRSQEIIDSLDLSQSAASRHLLQLSATGYLLERRCSGAKCYSMNEERVKDTLQAVSTFLLGD